MARKVGPNKYLNKLSDPARENKLSAGKEIPPDDRKWIKEYMAHGNAIKAAKEAWPDVTYATQLSRASKKKIEYKEILPLILEKAGLDDATLIGKLKEGMDAMKIHGTSDDFIEIPDHTNRFKYLKLAKEWKEGVEGGGKEKGSQTNIGEVKILVTRGDK